MMGGRANGGNSARSGPILLVFALGLVSLFSIISFRDPLEPSMSFRIGTR